MWVLLTQLLVSAVSIHNGVNNHCALNHSFTDFFGIMIPLVCYAIIVIGFITSLASYKYSS